MLSMYWLQFSSLGIFVHIKQANSYIDLDKIIDIPDLRQRKLGIQSVIAKAYMTVRCSFLADSIPF